MTANQMHIHSLINQLAANGFTYTTQNATDSLRDTHSFHFTHIGPNVKDRRQLTQNAQMQQQTEGN